MLIFSPLLGKVLRGAIYCGTKTLRSCHSHPDLNGHQMQARSGVFQVGFCICKVTLWGAKVVGAGLRAGRT